MCLKLVDVWCLANNIDNENLLFWMFAEVEPLSSRHLARMSVNKQTRLAQD